jgi:antirestriction protein
MQTLYFQQKFHGTGSAGLKSALDTDPPPQERGRHFEQQEIRKMMNSYEPRIFIGTPQAPACGEWLSLPISFDELAAARARIADGGDYIISDFEDLPGIGQFSSLFDVNEYAEWLVNEGPEQDILEALLDAGTSFQDLPQKYKTADYTAIEADDEEELAENFIDELGGLECAVSQENLVLYFDYAKYGRDLAIEGFHKYGSHYINLY